MTKKKWMLVLGFCLAGICLLTAVVFRIWSSNSASAKTVLRYYYENTCGACDLEEKFYELLNRETDDIRQKNPFAVQCINTFSGDDLLWEKDCDALAIPGSDRQLPMLIVGNRYLIGKQAIEREMRIALCTAMGIADSSSVWYFYRPDCPDCIQIEPIMSEILTGYPTLAVKRVDITEQGPKLRFKQLLHDLGIPEKEWEVPFIVFDGKFLSGNKAIEMGLVGLLGSPGNDE